MDAHSSPDQPPHAWSNRGSLLPKILSTILMVVGVVGLGFGLFSLRHSTTTTILESVPGLLAFGCFIAVGVSVWKRSENDVRRSLALLFVALGISAPRGIDEGSWLDVGQSWGQAALWICLGVGFWLAHAWALKVGRALAMLCGAAVVAVAVVAALIDASHIVLKLGGIAIFAFPLFTFAYYCGRTATLRHFAEARAARTSSA